MTASTTRAQKPRPTNTSEPKTSVLKTSALKTVTVAAAAAGLMVLGVGSASAHVHVDPASTSAGGFSQLTFRVPNESEGAKTTKAAATVTWTADAAHQLGQHEYQTFSISVGRLPDAGTTVALPAAQTYSDGTVVNWNEPEAAGQAEPEHPA